MDWYRKGSAKVCSLEHVSARLERSHLESTCLMIWRRSSSANVKRRDTEVSAILHGHCLFAVWL